MTTALSALGGASRQSRASARTELDRVIGAASAGDVVKLAADLFAIVFNPKQGITLTEQANSFLA